ncbi:hypothetical protein LR021_00555, partial [Candidatus Bipolaricaulota bacterium]|nr:hypothetical protein [Candidatus Bipolaricaulota bacterium]
LLSTIANLWEDRDVLPYARDSGLLAGTPAIIRVCQCPSVVLSSLGRGSGMGLLNMYLSFETAMSRI